MTIQELLELGEGTQAAIVWRWDDKIWAQTVRLTQGGTFETFNHKTDEWEFEYEGDATLVWAFKDLEQHIISITL